MQLVRKLVLQWQLRKSSESFAEAQPLRLICWRWFRTWRWKKASRNRPPPLVSAPVLFRSVPVKLKKKQKRRIQFKQARRPRWNDSAWQRNTGDSVAFDDRAITTRWNKWRQNCFVAKSAPQSAEIFGQDEKPRFVSLSPETQRRHRGQQRISRSRFFATENFQGVATIASRHAAPRGRSCDAVGGHGTLEMRLRSRSKLYAAKSSNSARVLMRMVGRSFCKRTKKTH